MYQIKYKSILKDTKCRRPVLQKLKKGKLHFIDCNFKIKHLKP